jgi:hypothetical protein
MKNLKEFETFQFLEGLEMEEGRINLPHFTLLHFADLDEHVFKKLADEQKVLYAKIIKSVNNSSIILCTKFKTENYQLANERARVLSEKFEHMMHFIIADLNFFYSIGTKNIRKFQLSTVISLDPDGIGFSTKTDVFHQNYKVNSATILSESYGYNKLWNLIGNDDLSPINKKIVTAIEWIGKALWERDYTKSFIQMMIAFEVLLQHQSHAFISSSIANQISEWGAFIYSDDLEIRLKTYKKIKDLYGLRSKVVHSGYNGINVNELYDALILIKNIIINLVTKEEFTDISLEALNDKINAKKFS